MITLRKRTLAAVLVLVAMASYWRGDYLRGLQEEVWTEQDELHLQILNDCLKEREKKEASI